MNKNEQLCKKLNQEVANFFNTNPIDYKLIVFESRDDFVEARSQDIHVNKSNIPNWIVAYTKYDGTIKIIGPNAMPAGYAKTGQLRFEMVLKHELGHIYVRKLNEHVPAWLNEGTCLFLAQQNNYRQAKPDEITINLLDEISDAKNDERVYRIGKNMVDLIIENYGKKALLELISIDNKISRDSRLKEMFSWLS